MSWGQEIFRTKYRETMESINTIYENYYDLDTQYQEEMKEKDDEIERLNNIIKEVREYITYWHYRNDFRVNSFTTGVKEELLEILDKVGEANENE